MVDAQRARVEAAMGGLIDEIDKSHLRKMQHDMHMCAARCCENVDVSAQQIQQCVEGCTIGLNQAQNYVQKELDGLQSRLQRCIMDCNDRIKDKLGPSPNDSDMQKYTKEFEDCAVKCVDSHVALIPSFLKRMKEMLHKRTFKE